MTESQSDKGGSTSTPPTEAVEQPKFEEAPTDPGRAEASKDEAPTEPTAVAAPIDPIAEAKAQAFEFKDKYLRMAADLDNFRKRSRREVEDAERRGKEGLLRDILPVFDNLERAVQHASQATDAKAVTDGVRMVLKQFESTLERVGIARVQTSGVPFDPMVHEAIQHLETTDHPPGTVVAEVQAGYQLGERLVRAALVVVAKAPAS
jgi:molecular chaperone GrpE